MSQLVASMLFHRQSDALRRHPSRKAGLDCTTSNGHSSYPHPSSMGDGSLKVLSKRRSKLSKVFLPEELESDSEEGEQGLGVEVETGDDALEEEEVDLDDRSLGRSCSEMDLDETVQGSSSSHSVTWPIPELSESTK